MGASGVEPDTSTKCCLICTVPIHFTRLGVHACRACAAFYKRTKVSGKRLICRQGDNKCIFRKHEKYMCKRCRFDKCVELGMEYTREVKEVKTDDTDDDIEPSTSKPKKQTLLEKLKIAYDACVERRRVREMELVKKHMLERVPDTTEEVYLLNFDCIVASSVATAPEFWKFFHEVIPFIKELPEELQHELYRVSITPFMMTESMHRAKRIWGRLEKYMMSSVLLCSHCDNLEVWLGPQEDGPLRKETLSAIRSYVDDQKRTIIPVFEKANLTEKEFLALLPLLLSEAELPNNFAEQYQPLLDSTRREILEDLQRLYTEEMGINEYSTRLGNLLTICTNSKESYELFLKFFRMQVTVFDMYKTETMLQDLIL